MMKILIIIGCVILSIVILLTFAITLLYKATNEYLNVATIGYNDIVILRDGTHRRLHAIMDIEKMKERQTIEPILKKDIQIIDGFTENNLTESIIDKCVDEPMSQSQKVEFVNSVKKGDVKNEE